MNKYTSQIIIYRRSFVSYHLFNYIKKNHIYNTFIKDNLFTYRTTSLL